jgi:Flp pilus assembly protein TadD
MNLAIALRQLGRIPEATQHYLEAIRLNPALGNQRP